MIPSYMEALVTWKEQPSHQAVKWFEGAGFSVQPGKSGLFVRAAAATFQSAFALSASALESGGQLPIPPELREPVATITVLRPREYLK